MRTYWLTIGSQVDTQKPFYVIINNGREGTLIMINAVITYTNNGTHKACGQTVGADGKGNKAILFDTETLERAEKLVSYYMKKLQSISEYHGHITNINIIIGYEEFMGNPILTITG